MINEHTVNPSHAPSTEIKLTPHSGPLASHTEEAPLTDPVEEMDSEGADFDSEDNEDDAPLPPDSEPEEIDFDEPDEDGEEDIGLPPDAVPHDH